MIKTLTRQGNSSALIIDKAIMDLMDIDQSTPLRLSVEGRRLVVEPVADDARSRKFSNALKKTLTRHRKAFKKLAE